jgi:hypothetical protein
VVPSVTGAIIVGPATLPRVGAAMVTAGSCPTTSEGASLIVLLTVMFETAVEAVPREPTAAAVEVF